MFVGNYSYDNTIFQIPKKRLRGCSLVISLPIDTKTSYMHARPSSIQRGKGCDVFIRVRESLTTGNKILNFRFLAFWRSARVVVFELCLCGIVSCS